jgi:hypothetical protein
MKLPINKSGEKRLKSKKLKKSRKRKLELAKLEKIRD